MVNHPVLYSYRRCPYAMRARLAIAAAGLEVEQREIVFWDKPVEMLEASPEGTVPVLILPDGRVIDESRDIMDWALAQADVTDNLLAVNEALLNLIDECDFEFKEHLDHYKYADRFLEFSQQHYRGQGELFLQKLEALLGSSQLAGSALALNGQSTSIVDLAVFPFVRQFAHVDKEWFVSSAYLNVQQWMAFHLASDLFLSIMKNRPVWQADHQPLWVLEPTLKTRDQFLSKALSKSSPKTSTMASPKELSNPSDE